MAGWQAGFLLRIQGILTICPGIGWSNDKVQLLISLSEDIVRELTQMLMIR